MKSFQKVIFTMAFTAIMLAAFPCAGQKTTTPKLETKIPFTVGAVNFQEWYAGINIGATGLNVFIPIAVDSERVTIDRIYFRNLTAKLEKKEGKYVAVLKNTHKAYTFKKSKRPENYPFTIADHECVISYFENNVRKYYKVKQLNEIASIYYKDGPPSLYHQQSSSSIATIDTDDDN